MFSYKISNQNADLQQFMSPLYDLAFKDRLVYVNKSTISGWHVHSIKGVMRRNGIAEGQFLRDALQKERIDSRKRQMRKNS